MMNASGAYLTLLSEFGLSGLFVGALALITRSLPLVSVVAFTLGFLITGAQAGLNALAASFYPTSIRSTGVGWALGVGRIGSIVGPLVAGMLLSNGWKPKDILLAGAVAGIFGWLVILLGNQIKGHVSPYAAELSVERSDRKEEVRV